MAYKCHTEAVLHYGAFFAVLFGVASAATFQKDRPLAAASSAWWAVVVACRGTIQTPASNRSLLVTVVQEYFLQVVITFRGGLGLA